MTHPANAVVAGDALELALSGVTGMPAGATCTTTGVAVAVVAPDRSALKLNV
jgi:hypothetical protein